MDTAKSNLDDLIFSNRNKDYGAYANRRNYHRYLFSALLIGTSIFFAGVSIPLIANYVKGDKDADKTVVYVKEILSDIKTDKPELPEMKEQKFEKPEFSYKKIVPTADTTAVFADLGELQKKIENRNPDDPGIDSSECNANKKPRIIDIPEPTPILVWAEIMPEFKGGDTERLKYLAKNIVYPDSDKKAEIDGTVYIGFVVDEKGMVCDVKVIRGVSPGLDAEAVRVVKGMPRWNPGMQNGQAVKVAFTMPIRFVLH